MFAPHYDSKDLAWLESLAASASTQGDYFGPPLSPDTAPSPWVLWKQWLEEAAAKGLPVNQMNLATANAQGLPSCRVVLLKAVDTEAGALGFFGSSQSLKGQSIQENPQVALHFYFPSLFRQILCLGDALPMEQKISNAYFQSRPKKSQAAACLGVQSAVVPPEMSLDDSLATLLTQDSFKRPTTWQGYWVQVHTMEFWQGQAGRLHDRLRFDLASPGSKPDRLYP